MEIPATKDEDPFSHEPVRDFFEKKLFKVFNKKKKRGSQTFKVSQLLQKYVEIILIGGKKETRATLKQLQQITLSIKLKKSSKLIKMCY